MKNKTEVICRKWKEGGEIIALFPYEIENQNGKASIDVMSYMHIGQHGGANYLGCIQSTIPAKRTEYQGLKDELENYVGYDLRVIKRRNFTRYADALRRELKRWRSL